jgi:hypothetical protein
MLTIDLDDFMFELDDGTLKHVGASNRTATAKLYDADAVELREFGDSRVKLSCEDESGNAVELALTADHARAIASEVERLEDESGIFE